MATATPGQRAHANTLSNPLPQAEGMESNSCQFLEEELPSTPGNVMRMSQFSVGTILSQDFRDMM